MPLHPAMPLRDPVLRAIEGALALHERRVVEAPDRRQAAVLLMLFERQGEPWIVLTKRTQHVRTHKGEISFPGGSKDEEDEDLWATAVRETHEELGVDPADLRLLGVLDDYPTFGSGFIVTAFVAAVVPGEYSPSAHEIDEVIELPLRRLVEVHRTEMWERDAIRFPMNLFEVDGHLVWGVTGYILRAFLDLVWDAVEQVQPVEEASGGGTDQASSPAGPPPAGLL